MESGALFHDIGANRPSDEDLSIAASAKTDRREHDVTGNQGTRPAAYDPAHTDGGTLALRAVVLDFGMVLTGQPDMQAHDAMVRMTGVTPERFEELYWADRHAYDEGKLTGSTFWQKFARDGSFSFSPGQIHELNRLDGRYWTTQNPAMVAWQAQLKAAGLRTGILSNMGDTVLASIEREFLWLANFDVLVWSFQLGIAKPDPAIYHYILEKLGTRAEETLFVDDKRVNIDAANALGMVGMEFTTIGKLRVDLLAAGLDGDLPIPAGVEG